MNGHSPGNVSECHQSVNWTQWRGLVSQTRDTITLSPVHDPKCLFECFSKSLFFFFFYNFTVVKQLYISDATHENVVTQYGILFNVTFGNSFRNPVRSALLSGKYMRMNRRPSMGSDPPTLSPTLFTACLLVAIHVITPSINNKYDNLHSGCIRTTTNPHTMNRWLVESFKCDSLYWWTNTHPLMQVSFQNMSPCWDAENVISRWSDRPLHTSSSRSQKFTFFPVFTGECKHILLQTMKHNDDNFLFSYTQEEIET